MSATAPTSEPVADLRSAIEEVFGARAGLAREYAELLVTDGTTRGMIGPREADRVWSRHLFNSAALAGLIPANARVVDLGSGAGLPGIPLAIARPDLDMVLLEPMQRRVRFLHDCLRSLGLGGVEVVAGRAEDGVLPPADCVVVRAVAPLDRLVPLSFELLRDNGVLLALKGRAVTAELEAFESRSDVPAQLLTVPVAGEIATVVQVFRPPRRRASRRAR